MEDSLVHKEYSTRDTHVNAAKHKTLRKELLEKGFLYENDEKTWRMVDRYPFNSPSQAASVVLGCNARGAHWRKSEGVLVSRLRSLTAV